VPPPKYRNTEASSQHDDPEADLYPVLDRRGISTNRPIRPVYEQRIYKIIIEVRDFSLDKAMPQLATAIDTQIDRDDASDDFIKEKLHSNIRASHAPALLGVAGFGVGSIAGLSGG
jgi:hypothetical protein